MTPSRTALLAVLAALTAAGCRTVEPGSSWTYPAAHPDGRPAAADRPSGVVPAAHAEPADKSAAQPTLPPPRPVEPATKSAPPAPPTNVTSC